jgi:hypothetical protein
MIAACNSQPIREAHPPPHRAIYTLRHPQHFLIHEKSRHPFQIVVSCPRVTRLSLSLFACEPRQGNPLQSSCTPALRSDPIHPCEGSQRDSDGRVLLRPVGGSVRRGARRRRVALRLLQELQPHLTRRPDPPQARKDPSPPQTSPPLSPSRALSVLRRGPVMGCGHGFGPPRGVFR